MFGNNSTANNAANTTGNPAGQTYNPELGTTAAGDDNMGFSHRTNAAGVTHPTFNTESTPSGSGPYDNSSSTGFTNTTTAGVTHPATHHYHHQQHPGATAAGAGMGAGATGVGATGVGATGAGTTGAGTTGATGMGGYDTAASGYGPGYHPASTGRHNEPGTVGTDSSNRDTTTHAGDTMGSKKPSTMHAATGNVAGSVKAGMGRLTKNSEMEMKGEMQKAEALREKEAAHALKESRTH